MLSSPKSRTYEVLSGYGFIVLCGKLSFLDNGWKKLFVGTWTSQNKLKQCILAMTSAGVHDFAGFQMLRLDGSL